jgi:hypothetical protein
MKIKIKKALNICLKLEMSVNSILKVDGHSLVVNNKKVKEKSRNELIG